MTAQQQKALSSAAPSKASRTPQTSNSVRSSRGEHSHLGPQSTSSQAYVAHDTNIVIRFPPFEHDLDFVLYPSPESLSFDTECTSNIRAARSYKSRSPLENTASRQCSEQGLEKYLASEEYFERVALGLETQRATRDVIDPRLLDILDAL
ncbi:uncharacterized protein LY89DRAFT_50236 [Mollisia scopiformis]|uniref:Uncharacterized protein n=1 Tax=Mollisia scopiformis TaxID=149040 RepID=A0A194XAV6_MOLSC|nr:uncharacterized protein LY89DRAFT_50236 [Mollisia scopiformis]KUJ17293.1 hypothetical protein LY89DRAFT_50236 [Mollisia scopiformis]